MTPATHNAQEMGKMIDPMESIDGGEMVKGKEGWTYRDVPWLTEEAGGVLLGIIGEGEFMFLARTIKSNGDWRGQVLISPKGMENIKAHAAKATPGRDA